MVCCLNVLVSLSQLLKIAAEEGIFGATYRHEGCWHVDDSKHGEEFHRGRILFHGPANSQRQFAVMLRGLCEFAHMHIVRNQGLSVCCIKEARDLSWAV